MDSRHESEWNHAWHAASGKGIEKGSEGQMKSKTVSDLWSCKVSHCWGSALHGSHGEWYAADSESQGKASLRTNTEDSTAFVAEVVVGSPPSINTSTYRFPIHL